MKIQLLIATADSVYAERLSEVLTEKYSDRFEVSVCSASASLRELTSRRKFDAALMDPAFECEMDAASIRLPLLLWSGEQETDAERSLRKYQRISSLISQVQERYAEIADARAGLAGSRARITVVWSPAGGCGKTTVALAYAARQAAVNRAAVYLNLEPFSSAQAFFRQEGKSISTVFEKLDGNTALLLQSIRQEDSGSGIFYFNDPDNYDDMNALTCEDLTALINGCAEDVDDLVVDLGSVCDERIQKVLELADTVLLVVDRSPVAQAKWSRFRTQHNVFEAIRAKTILVANKGAVLDAAGVERVISIPFVPLENPITVYKNLSAGYFYDENSKESRL